MTNPRPKRKRGAVLTPQGWQRLLVAKRQSELQENSGGSYTLEELSQRTNLSPNTLMRIQRRQVAVDAKSLECYFNAFNLSLTSSDYTKLDPNQLQTHPRVTDNSVAINGQVPLDSPLYVERPPIELLCYETILQPGALIRIKAPKQMGKTSLMARILASAIAQGFKTVRLSLQLADADVFSSLSQFLRWFCAVITRRLELPNQLNDYWDEVFGSNYNCTDYFENYLLSKIDCPLVLALDEVDVVFNYPKIATDFFGMLRTWYQKAKYADKSSIIWQKLRLVIVHSTEVYIPLNINQSPFNVGLSIELPDFTLLQVKYLANQYQLNWETKDVEPLMHLIGGKPYLVQLALHHISFQNITLEQLLETTAAEDGIYKDYLQRLLWTLQQYPELVAALMQVVTSSSPVKLDPIQAFKLQSMGLVQVQNRHVVPSCNLYRHYFSDRLSQLQLNLLQEHRLTTIVSINVVDFPAQLADDLEQTPNPLYQDFQLISQLAQQYEGQILKITGEGMFIDFPNTVNAVNCAQDIQLAFRQIAETSSELMLAYRIGIHYGDVIFSLSDITGSGINIANKVQAEISPGGIGISQTVYEAVKSYLPLQPIEIGQRKLEGLEYPMLLYQLSL